MTIVKRESVLTKHLAIVGKIITALSTENVSKHQNVSKIENERQRLQK